tara:strand:- start:539 stop:1867 length:1329 start_codon:yes stop_codon:yes gene_type:complete
MAMDQMIQNRNMPQQGMQSVFNPTTGTFVNVPFQTDPNFPGRRVVMTPSGPQVLPGFQGQENPYRALGRGVRNLLGNLFNRGSLRREERKAQKQVMEQADPMLDTMDPSVVERPEFEPVPDNQARIDELQERINRPIVTSQNLPTFDVSRVRGQTAKLSQEDKNIENFLPAGVTSDGRIVNGQTTTKATREQLRTALQDRKSLEGVDQRTKDLRGEFRRATDQFSKIDQAFGRLQGSLTGTGAGDLSLIFQYMKILDPGSTVREGEFATAQNAGGVDDKVRSLYNQIVEGARLSASQRIDFYERSKDLYKAEKEGYDLNVETFNDLAEKSKVNKELVTYDRANAAATGDKINIIFSSLDESELNDLDNEELKRLGGQDLVNRFAKFKQGGGESSADKFGFSTMPQVTIEKIANQDRQSLIGRHGQEFVDALEAELIRRDEQK